MKMYNIGVYKGSHIVDFTPINGKQRITLIGGLNGAGKTSLKDAIQIGMFGVNHVENRDEKSYHKILKQKITNGQKSASITIEFRHVTNWEETKYCVLRDFTLNSENQVEENVSVFENEKKNDFLSGNWDVQSNIYFPARLKNLFVFDGEKLSSYSSNESLRNLIEYSLKIMFGVDNIEQLTKDLEYYTTQKQKFDTSKDIVVEVERLEHRIGKVKNQITQLRQEKASIQSNKIDKTLLLLREAEIKYKEAGGVFFDRREEIVRQVEREIENTEAKEKQLINLAGTELPLALIRGLLQRTLDQVEMEEQKKYNVTREEIIKQRDKQILKFLSELEVPSSKIEILKERLGGEYSALNAKELFQSITVDIETKKVLERLLEVKLEKSVADARQKIDEMKIQRSKLTLAIDERDSIPEAGTVGQLLKEVNKLKQMNEVHNSESQSCESRLRDLSSLRDAMLLERNELLKENIEIIHKNRDIERTLQHVNKVKETLELLRSKLALDCVNDVMKELSSCLNVLCHDTLSIERVQIDERSFELSLYSPDKTLIDIEQLSAGQRQLVCLAVMWALKRLSRWTLPIIIDTPFSRLDSAHRKNFLQNYIQNVSHQVVILSTDREIDYKSWEYLNEWLARAYTLKFDKETQSTSIVLGYFGYKEHKNESS